MAILFTREVKQMWFFRKNNTLNGGAGGSKGGSSKKTSFKQKVSNTIRGTFGLKKVKVA